MSHSPTMSREKRIQFISQAFSQGYTMCQVFDFLAMSNAYGTSDEKKKSLLFPSL